MGLTNEFIYTVEIQGLAFTFETSPEIFSPKRADPGTMAMLTVAAPYLTPGVKTLDLGCGCGIAGIFASRLCGAENVTMSDISSHALELSAKNAARNGLPSPPKIVESQGFAGIDDAGFDLILSNPPYHADFSVPKEFIEKGFNRLKIGGRLIMVTKRLDWYKKKIISVFGGVLISREGDYHVFVAERRRAGRGSGAAT